MCIVNNKKKNILNLSMFEFEMVIKKNVRIEFLIFSFWKYINTNILHVYIYLHINEKSFIQFQAFLLN